jgi:hypothetical protein
VSGDNPGDLDALLRSVSTRLDVPPTPHITVVTDAVLARLDEPAPRTGWRPVQRVVAAAVAALLALATAMVVSPAVRAAVFDLLRIGGVEIHENQPPPVTPTVDPPLPGERDVTLAQARAEASFPLKLPADLGAPTHVRLADGTPPRVVTMAFTDIHRTDVDGDPAIYVDRPHVVIYDDRDGTLREATARLAAATLIWESDGITYRLEGDLTEDEAVAIAESMR